MRLAALLLVLSLPGALLAAQESPPGASKAVGDEIEDVVVFKNGDRLTGDIKRLERGRITFENDALGTVEIAWVDISRIASVETFEVETVDGTDYFGALPEPDADERLRVSGAEGIVVLEAHTIIRLTPIESSWLSRLGGSLSLGYNFTKANRTSQLSFDATVNQTTRKHNRSLSLSGLLTDREDSARTRRFDASFSNRRDLQEPLFFESLAAAQSNEELGLDLRLLAGTGIGRTFIQKPDRSLALSAGFALSQEQASRSGPSETSWEGFLLMRMGRFWVHDPEIDLDFGLVVFPGISPSGGFRAELDASVRREVVHSLFLSMSVFESYDSDPLAKGAENSDYGAVTSLGWSF